MEGYFEPVIQKLDDPQLEHVVRERIAGKIAARRGDVAEYISQR